MPDSSHKSERVCADVYGVNSVVRASRIVAFCIKHDFHPEVVFSVDWRGSYFVAVEHQTGRMLYLKTIDFRNGRFASSFVPELFSRGLKAKAANALSQHISASMRTPVTIDLLEAASAK